jgi:hypothetical protein
MDGKNTIVQYCVICQQIQEKWNKKENYKQL